VAHSLAASRARGVLLGTVARNTTIVARRPDTVALVSACARKRQRLLTLTFLGCQSQYGQCTSSTPPIAKVSTDGTCGGSNGFTCLASKYGSCCSQYNYCGGTAAYCGKGCNPKFGSCSTSDTIVSVSPSLSASSALSAPSASSIPSQKVSTNARCGHSNGATENMTCSGSRFGNCCSRYSYWYVSITLILILVIIPWAYNWQWFIRCILWDRLPGWFWTLLAGSELTIYH
jgi:hypothetical protein